MSALTVSIARRAPFGTRTVRIASSSSSCRYLRSGRETLMRTWRSLASYSSVSLSLSSTAVSSTSLRSQAVTSTRPWTFSTSTSTSAATVARLVMFCAASAGCERAASVAAARQAILIVISGTPRGAVTRGDDLRIQLQFLLVRPDQQPVQQPARRVARERRIDLVGRLLDDREVREHRFPR